MELPTFDTYGDYSSANYGANALVFSTDKGRFWFSYQTLVAFQPWGGELTIRENIWGPTTGKHLNWIDRDHSIRVNTVEFEKAYTEKFGQAVPA